MSQFLVNLSNKLMKKAQAKKRFYVYKDFSSNFDKCANFFLIVSVVEQLFQRVGVDRTTTTTRNRKSYNTTTTNKNNSTLVYVKLQQHYNFISFDKMDLIYGLLRRRQFNWKYTKFSIKISLLQKNKNVSLFGRGFRWLIDAF
jgi:hypothetical protein